MKRLDAVLSACSVGSRSEVKALIRKGKVTVNGEVVRDPSMSVSPDAEITVNGVPTDTSEFVYLMLNKPCGFVSTTDEKERNVLEFVPSELFRKGMFPVGRLDKDTSGLLLLTNDGDFSHRLTSPSHEVEKEYTATLERPLDDVCFDFFENGMTLKDGFETKPAKLEAINEKTALLSATANIIRFEECLPAAATVSRRFAASASARSCLTPHSKRVRFGG